MKDFQKISLKIAENHLLQTYYRITDLYLKDEIGDEYIKVMEKLADAENELNELIKNIK